MSHAVSSASLIVLYIDDSRDDRDLMTLAVNRARAPFKLHCVENIASAKAYLNADASFISHAGAPAPTLILVDYSIGPECGCDLITWIRNHPQLASLTIVACSDLEADNRFEKSYLAGANYCLKKPVNLERLMSFVECLGRCIALRPPCYQELQSLEEYRAQNSKFHNSPAQRKNNTSRRP